MIKRKRDRRQLFPRGWYVNAIGAFGYLLLSYSATISLCCIILVLITLGFGGSSVEQVTNTQQQTTAYGAILALSYLITTLIVILSIALFVMLPYIVGKYVSRAVHTVFRFIRVDQTNKDLLLFKIVLTVIPLIVVVGVSYAEVVEPTIASALLITQIVATIVSIVFFAVQHSLAKRHERVVSTIW